MVNSPLVCPEIMISSCEKDDMGGNISPSVGCSPDLVYQGEIKQSAVIQPLEGAGVNMLEPKRPSKCINVFQ